MWMIVMVAVASGEVVYVDSAADSNFFRSEKECETVLTEQFEKNPGTELIKSKADDQLLLRVRLGEGYALRACVQSPPIE